jgi:uncharacterized protein YndB with AHSA1/START domain
MAEAQWRMETVEAEADKGGEMDAIVESIDITRSPEEVFAYATDFTHFPEWQSGVLSARREGDGRLAVGSKATVVRTAGPRKLTRTEEITEFDPPRSWTVRGVGGPLTAIARGTVEPLDEGERSRVTIALEFEGHGIGTGLLPLIRRQARRQLPKNEQRLKQLLERGA